MKAEDLLFKAGWGSRRQCRTQIYAKALEVEGRLICEPNHELEEVPNSYVLSGNTYPFREHWFVMLNKPCGYECSHKPSRYPSVFTLFPDWMVRQGLQSAGRLDVDTSGLLLLSNCGSFVHHVESPRKALGKRYVIRSEKPLDDSMRETLLQGVELKGERGVCRALQVNCYPDPHVFSMEIDRGVYHQVRRMLVAVGNAVLTLHREAVAELELPGNLALGTWRELSPQELEKLQWIMAL